MANINVSIAILDARRWVRWLRICISVVVTIILPVMLGIWVQSTAMQWIGFVMSIVLLFNVASVNVKRFTSVEAARKYLNSLEDQ